MSTLDIVGLGAMNYDHLYMVDKVVIDGEQVIQKSLSQPGGSAANTVYGLAKLGIKCGFIGAVGSDKEGKQLIEDLNKVGVDVSHIKIKAKVKTGSTVCLTDKLSRRAIYINPGANKNVKYTDLNIDYVKSAKIIHLSSFVNDEQFILQNKLIEQIDNKPKISFSPGMLYVSRGMKKLKPILNKTYLLFINQDEIETLTNKDFIAGAKDCLKVGCRFVIVTLGKGLTLNGITTYCYIVSTEQDYKISAPKQSRFTKLESTGAGDAFTAGFLFGFIKGKDTETCGIIGHTMAALTIRNMGARKGLPYLELLSNVFHQFTGNIL